MVAICEHIRRLGHWKPTFENSIEFTSVECTLETEENAIVPFLDIEVEKTN